MPNPRIATGRPGTPIANTAAYRLLRRRMTTGFIQTAPVVLTLVPRTKTEKPAGGFAWTDQTARAPQTFRIGEPTDPPHVVQGSDGIEREAHLTLVGEYNATLGLYDWFSYGGHRFEVAQILFTNDFETRAEVLRLG